MIGYSSKQKIYKIYLTEISFEQAKCISIVSYSIFQFNSLFLSTTNFVDPYNFPLLFPWYTVPFSQMSSNSRRFSVSRTALIAHIHIDPIVYIISVCQHFTPLVKFPRTLGALNLFLHVVNEMFFPNTTSSKRKTAFFARVRSLSSVQSFVFDQIESSRRFEWTV